MNRILHRTFDGLVPRLEPSMLAENAAQIAQDVDLRRGVLTPVLGRAADSDVVGYNCGSTTRTIYLWRYTDWVLQTATLGTTTPGTWAAVASAGKFKITVDDVVYECNPVLGSCASMAAVATALQVAIRAQTEGLETVEYVAAVAGPPAVGAHFVIHGNSEVTTIAAPAAGTDLAAAGFLNGAGTASTNTGEKWLAWTGDVNVVQSPINDDAYSRVYYTGDGVPMMRLRMAGADVARNMKIEVPAKPTLTGTAFGAGSPSAANAAFVFSAGLAKMKLECNGTTQVWNSQISFTKTGDTIVIDDLSFTTPNSYIWFRDIWPVFTVNGKPVDAKNGAVITSDDGAYTMKVVWDTFAWSWRNEFPVGVASYDGHKPEDIISWGGSIKLVFSTAATGVTDAADASHATAYCVSYVTDIGEEGPLSPASDVFLSAGTNHIHVGGLAVPADTARGIVTLRIYRAAAGSFRLLADVAVTTNPLTYQDDTVHTDADLGEVAHDLTTNPPDDLTGLVACAGGWFAGFSGRQFMASEANIPSSWPDAYRLTVQAPIVALAATGNDTFVMTQGRPVMMSGSDPATLTAVNIESDQACVSAAGVVLLGQSVVYPSPDGLVAMYAGAAKVVTAEWFRREDWQALLPEGIRAAAHDGRYYAVLGGLAEPYMLIVDFSESVDRVTTAAGPDLLGLYADLLDDTLYVIEDDEIRIWRGGEAPLQLDWRGREWLFPQPVSFAVLRVLAADYTAPVGDAEDARPLVTLYANGVEVLERRVTGPTAAKLPRLRPERRWSLRVQSAVEVTEINLATGMEALTR